MDSLIRVVVVVGVLGLMGSMVGIAAYAIVATILLRVDTKRGGLLSASPLWAKTRSRDSGHADAETQRQAAPRRERPGRAPAWRY